MPAASGHAEPHADQPLTYEATVGADVPFADPEPAEWAGHQRFRRELQETLERGESPGLSLEDAILMIDARIAADRR